MAMGRSRLPELDLLRFSAAASVLVFHFYVLLPGDTGLQRAVAGAGRFGFLGVPLFFMISGFVILWTAYNKSPREFAIARFCRLYPSYWICVLITSGVLVLAGIPVSWARIAANLTMLQHLFGFRSIDQVYWTLFVELKFYGLVLVLLLCRQLPRVERWLGVWLACAAVSLLAWGSGSKAVPGLDVIVFEGEAAYFAGGCFAFLIYTYGSSGARWAGFAVSALLSVVSALKFQNHYTQSNDWQTLATVAGCMLVAYGVFGAVCLRRFTLPAWPVWYWLGSLTYPLYLLHAMAGKELYGMLPPVWGVWTRIAVTLVAVFAVTAVLAVAIEQHGCNALYRRLSGVGCRQSSVKPQGSAPETAQT